MSSRWARSGLSVPAPPAARFRMTSVICSEYGRAAATRDCALTMREAAMSSIALVIFLVLWTDRILVLRMRSWPPATCRSLALGLGLLGGREQLLELLDGVR